MSEQTSLHQAIARGSETVSLLSLIEECSNINTLDESKNTPLHVAIRKKCGPDIIRCLTTKGAHLGAQNIDGCTPLHLALDMKCNKDIILHLIKNTDEVNINIQDKNRRTALHTAINKGYELEVVRSFVMKGTNMDIKDKFGRTPLHHALFWKIKIEIVMYLIENTVDVSTQDGDGNTPLHTAIQKEYELGILRSLVRKGATFCMRNRDGRTPLHLALYWKKKIVMYLLENTVDVSTQDDDGNTPLHTAIGNYKLGILRSLVTKGANLDIQNNRGSTPLHLAIARRIRGSIDFLVKHTVNINIQDNLKRTPLHHAIMKNLEPQIVRSFTVKGADFNIQDKNGITPFLLITESSRLSLLAGAFPEEVNDLKNNFLDQGTTLYDILVLRCPLDWTCVERPMDCFSDRNKKLWSVMLSTIVANRAFSLRLHTNEVFLDEDSSLHVTNFLSDQDIVNLLLVFGPFLHKRSIDSPSPGYTKHIKPSK